MSISNGWSPSSSNNRPGLSPWIYLRHSTDWHPGLLAKHSAHLKSGISDMLHSRCRCVFQQLNHSSLLVDGLLQGSVLGLVLLLIYINDLTNTLENPIFLFADSTFCHPFAWQTAAASLSLSPPSLLMCNCSDAGLTNGEYLLIMENVSVSPYRSGMIVNKPTYFTWSSTGRGSVSLTSRTKHQPRPFLGWWQNKAGLQSQPQTGHHPSFQVFPW